MTHIITRACCNDASCVPVCPVNCIHPTPDEPGYETAEMLYIDPDVCIDCGACVDVCPVGAITADYDLAPEHARFEEINARYFASPARSDYPQQVQSPPERRWESAPPGTLRVAVVGSGPAAFYVAEEILAQRGLETEVDMFERLPTPWGLLRFGVAPDHQDTKTAASSFQKTMRRRNFRLFLNTEIGEQVTFEQLRRRYHAVVYATGAMGDRSLDIPGEDLPGSHSATEFVAWYNGHPDFAHRTFDLSQERAVVVGNGNVALDVARILLSHPDALARTDIADHALAQLRKSNVREVVIVGRRGPLEAAFTTKELLGLAQTPGVDLVVRPDELALDPASRALAGDPAISIPLYKAELLSELGTKSPTQERRVTLRFLASPAEVRGDGWVEGIRLRRNRLVQQDDRVVAVGTDDVEDLSCGLLLRSVGYRGRPVAGLPFDEARGVIPNDGGRVVDPDTGEPVLGVYTAGWIKRGPSGVIGTNKQCARESVERLFDDYMSGRLAAPPENPGDVADVLTEHVDLPGWKLIDDHERAAGREQRRPRVKLVDIPTMLDVARQGA